MDRNSILDSHFIKFVDTNHPSIRQHQRSSFQIKLSSSWIFYNWSSQPRGTWTLSTSIYANRGHLMNEFQKLGFSRRRISD